MDTLLCASGNHTLPLLLIGNQNSGLRLIASRLHKQKHRPISKLNTSGSNTKPATITPMLSIDCRRSAEGTDRAGTPIASELHQAIHSGLYSSIYLEAIDHLPAHEANAIQGFWSDMPALYSPQIVTSVAQPHALTEMGVFRNPDFIQWLDYFSVTVNLNSTKVSDAEELALQLTPTTPVPLTQKATPANFTPTNLTPTNYSKPPHRAIVKTLKFLQQHFKEPNTLAKVAKEANVSQSHLTALLRTELNTSLKKLHIRIRLKESIRLMRSEPYAQIAHITLRSGFSDESFFEKKFREWLGFTPTLFRKHYVQAGETHLFKPFDQSDASEAI